MRSERMQQWRRGAQAVAMLSAVVIGWLIPAVSQAAAPMVRAFEPPQPAIQVEPGKAVLPDGSAVDYERAVLSVDPVDVTGGRLVARPDQPLVLKPKLDTLMLGFLHHAVVPGSVQVTAADGTVLAEGEHYALDLSRGVVEGIDGGLGDGPVTVTYRYRLQRLDLVQVDAAGNLSLKRGEPAVVCPALPEADAGCVGLAGVYVYPVFHPDRPNVVTADDLFPIDASAPGPEPINPAALSVTVSKLRRGQRVQVGFFGGSVTLGAEAGRWWSDRSQTYTRLVERGLADRFAGAVIEAVPGYRGKLTLHDERAKQTFDKVMAQARPADRGHVVWWEAEQPRDTNFPGETELSPQTLAQRAVLADGQWLSFVGELGEQLPFAVYRLTIPAKGRYRFFLRGSGWPSLRYRFGDQPWQEPKGSPPRTHEVAFDDKRKVNWFDVGHVDLPEGPTTFRIELKGEAGKGRQVAFDCFALSSGSFTPQGRYRPEQLYLQRIVAWQAEAAAAKDLVEAPSLQPQNAGERRALSEGQWLAVKATIRQPRAPSITYDVDVPEAGVYELWARVMLNGTAFRWRINDGPWNPSPTAPQRGVHADAMRPGLSLVWQRLGPVDLAAGGNRFTVQLAGEPGAPVLAGFDCFALTQGLFTPGGPDIPLAGDPYLDLLVMAPGLADEQTPPQVLARRLRSMVQAARQRGAEVLLVTPLQPNPLLEAEAKGTPMAERAEAIRHVAREMDVACADVHAAWQSQARRGVPPVSQLHNWINHPGSAGHRLYAETILDCFGRQ
jgi:hypothetical protein